MVDIAALENTLNEQLEAGLITDHEFRRIMSRATGGVYLDAEQQESYNNAQEWSAGVISTLNKLHVIGPKRIDSTTRKLNSSLVRFIAKGGYVNESGCPDLSEMDNWTLTETVVADEEE
jgi:hypothetical protein